MVKDPKICEPARANFVNNNEDYICIANGEKGKDTCYGDSGGPVYSRSQDEKYNLLLGLTSYGETTSNKKSDIYRPLCAVSDTFGFYTRVGYYIDFIAALTNNKRDYYTIDQTKSTRGILNRYNSAESAIIIM
ncbi:Clotting factor B [Zancudomyces culisetae]|uniref:Clotting factor B n=1 Tax=Zancudomyces culisetae TaxID=1213189 RepID=A0A1R1PQC4_ZANCU|nr:Clotting factor B [Zancudomyces culisetae]|eukprot:OMH83185.1 Clotting factor B [Zancudomyces culisetae]